MPPRQLPPIPDDVEGVTRWVTDHLGHVCRDDPVASPTFRGGQTAADDALAALDIDGYARRRSQVHPPSARGASKLSPWIRHGLLPLRRVWDAVEDATGNDRFRYRSELLWQDYARHWYAVLGTESRRTTSYEPVVSADEWPREPWPEDMACIDRTLAELHTDGWCVNQTRMWLASQYAVRGHGWWRDGEDEMFAHLLDGSRAANRLGWQWVVGGTRSKPYGFARRQVLKRARAFCETCELYDDCPIVSYADVVSRGRAEPPDFVPLDDAFGPAEAVVAERAPEVVWLTAESLGDADPALDAHPDLPVVFVFDEPLLARLQLSGKRLIFLAEGLADLATRRDVEVHLGSPPAVLDGRPAAVTAAPVPGFRRLAAPLSDLTRHPWPWLRPPTARWRERLLDRGRVPGFRDFCRLTDPDA